MDLVLILVTLFVGAHHEQRVVESPAIAAIQAALLHALTQTPIGRSEQLRNSPIFVDLSSFQDAARSMGVSDPLPGDLLRALVQDPEVVRRIVPISGSTDVSRNCPDPVVGSRRCAFNEGGSLISLDSHQVDVRFAEFVVGVAWSDSRNGIPFVSTHLLRISFEKAAEEWVLRESALFLRAH